MNKDIQPSAATALLDYQAAARYLGGLSRSTLKALAANSDLRVVHIGRRALFRRDDLDAFIARKSQGDAV
jgi:excisionase family DNA binding protein